ncbi:thiopurine S-methyltransferase isoform X2 [Apteryx rowi]|uniref:thiopurine S-methyltransferase isoform X2 n=1 Tax=Apteryx rowi TaxID=308060 RepID=UPI000E1C419C|nr:thiopurine S-methyltransferase isoform X2 [Apteryx rowi]
MDGAAEGRGAAGSADTGAQERVVAEQEWLQRWETGKIGFHKEQRHPLLQKYLDILLNGRSGLRIFFPLCGKAVEMKWLADMGHRVIGVEISEQALKEFFAEHSLPYREEPVPGTSGAKMLQSMSGNISLYCCSIYDLSSYASLMISLMEKSSSYLLVTVLYDPNKHKGPPFYVPESEIKSLYGNQCEIKCLQKVNDFSDRHREWGLDYFLEVLYILKFVP